VSKQELEMASKLIDSYKGPWQPAKYKDTYRDELRAVIKAKERGGKVAEAREPEPEAPPDLMEALRQSVRSAGAGAPRRKRAKR
jgi:DNA end-binding protein Ku